MKAKFKIDLRKCLLAAAIAWGSLFAVITSASGQTWTLTSAPQTGWKYIASSATGAKLAATDGFRVFTSTNSGVAWTLVAGPDDSYREAIASSADGTKLITGDDGGLVYISTNSGITWDQTSLPQRNWKAYASSADGTTLVVGAWTANPAIFVSTNSGDTWTQVFSFGWSRTIVCSADGKQIVAPMGNSIYTSTNYGATWISNNVPPWQWISVASSADGITLAAVSFPPNGFDPVPFYISTNGGAAWTATTISNGNWSSIACSADGTKLIVSTFDGPIYTSTDSGGTWVSNTVPGSVPGYQCVASSADGNKLAAASYQQIYTGRSMPAPQLNARCSDANLFLSWLVPSMDFVLQENTDLTTTNWITLSNTPTLNFTNLNNELVLPLSGDRSFYRLMAPD